MRGICRLRVSGGEYGALYREDLIVVTPSRGEARSAAILERPDDDGFRFLIGARSVLEGPNFDEQSLVVFVAEQITRLEIAEASGAGTAGEFDVHVRYFLVGGFRRTGSHACGNHILEH